MKVLAIMGSPKRKGTGYEAVQKIERRMNQEEKVEFDYIFLRDAQLGMCRGCFNCVARGEDTCPMREEQKAIEARMEDADGIILASPTYVQNVSGLMKNFMDRFAYTHHRPILLDKKTLVVANGGAGLKNVTKALSIAVGGPKVVGEVRYLHADWPLAPKVVAKRDRNLEEQALRFYRAIKAKDDAPSFRSYLDFRFFKSISESVKQEFPADFAYYSQREEYHHPARIGIGKRIGAWLLLRIVTLTVRDMAPYHPEERTSSDKNDR